MPPQRTSTERPIRSPNEPSSSGCRRVFVRGRRNKNRCGRKSFPVRSSLDRWARSVRSSRLATSLPPWPSSCCAAPSTPQDRAHHGCSHVLRAEPARNRRGRSIPYRKERPGEIEVVLVVGVICVGGIGQSLATCVLFRACACRVDDDPPGKPEEKANTDGHPSPW